MAICAVFHRSLMVTPFARHCYSPTPPQAHYTTCIVGIPIKNSSPSQTVPSPPPACALDTTPALLPLHITPTHALLAALKIRLCAELVARRHHSLLFHTCESLFGCGLKE
jgi:hypothetical protein